MASGSTSWSGESRKAPPPRPPRRSQVARTADPRAPRTLRPTPLSRDAIAGCPSPARRARRSRSDPRSRWWVAAAFALAAGLAVIVLAVNSSGSRLAGRTADLTAARSGQAEAGTKIFGGAVRTTIVGIGHAIRAQAVLASAQARPPHRQQVGHRQRTQSRIPSGAARSHPSTTGQDRSTSEASRGIAATSDTHSSAPRLTTTSETQSNTPPATGVSTSESTTSHNSSTTATSHPAGPTGSNPLGGIGSCVKGC